MSIRKNGKLYFRLVISFVIMMVVMSLVVAVTALLTSATRAFDTYNKLAEQYGEYVSELVGSGDRIDEWIIEGTDDYYDAIHEECLHTREIFDSVEDLYVYYPTRDKNGNILNDMTIIVDTPNEQSNEYEFGYHFGKSKAYETILKVFETRETVTHDKIENDGGKMILAVFSPIKYSDGRVAAVAGVEIEIARVIERIIMESIYIASIADMGIIAFAVFLILYLRSGVIRPLKALSVHMNRFVSDEGVLVYEPITEIHTNDEIEQMADDFNALAKRIIDYTDHLEVQTTVAERRRVDLDVASQIRSVVSSEINYPAFPERTDFDLCASLGHTLYNRCSFCNYFFTDTNHLFVVLGESLGEGLAAMIFTVLAISYIKSFAKMGFGPGKIAAETNNQLCSKEKKDRGLTIGAVIADIDLKTGVMRYVNAGMPPILIKKPGEDFRFDKAKLPFSLGQMRGLSFEQSTLSLYQGSTLLFTSFGISEMCDPSGSKYTMERLRDSVNRISGNVYALDETISELEAELEKFRNDTPVSMDTAVLGFRYFG